MSAPHDSPAADRVSDWPAGITVRHDVRPGDFEALVAMHCSLYASEYGFDEAFETHVSEPLAPFLRSISARERLWIAEAGGRTVGCIAIVAETPDVARLRWFLVAPEVRRCGLGGRLVAAAVAFSRGAGYRSIVLGTVSALTAARRLYETAGFRVVKRTPGCFWGVDTTEERYELSFDPAGVLLTEKDVR